MPTRDVTLCNFTEVDQKIEKWESMVILKAFSLLCIFDGNRSLTRFKVSSGGRIRTDNLLITLNPNVSIRRGLYLRLVKALQYLVSTGPKK